MSETVAPGSQSASTAPGSDLAARIPLDNTVVRRVGIWLGAVSLVLTGIGWVALMRNLPPIPPSYSATDVAEVVLGRSVAVRAGAVLTMIAVILYVPWAAALASLTRRAERDYPVLVWTQIGAAAVSAALVTHASLCFIVAAYRPDRPAEDIRLLTDFGYFGAYMTFPMFCAWTAALGLAILRDPRPQPAYPRWAGYYCLFSAFLYLPGATIPFFYRGAFGWNGALGLYLPGAAYFTWMAVMTYVGMKAISRQAFREGTAARSSVVQPQPNQ